MKFYISNEVHKKFPDVGLVLLPVYGVTVKMGKRVLSEQTLRKQLSKLSEKEFFGQEMFAAFRDFHEALGLGIEAGLPSVENLYRRYLKTGKLAQINNIVDAANKVAVETLVPSGVFDMAAIKEDLVLRFSRQGEEFKPLGGGVEALPEGVAVIADEEKILNRFPYRDSEYAKITGKTKDVLILGDVVAGVSQKKTQDAVEQVGRLLEEIAGGRMGKVFYSKEVKSGTVEGVGVSRKKVRCEQKRVLSGIRATGRLHLGNYLGAVKGMLALSGVAGEKEEGRRKKEEGEYETLYMIADLHTMTTPFSPAELRKNRLEVAMDYLAAGLDPQKSVIFAQSDLADLHAQLMFYFTTVVSVARMRHLPTFKEKVNQYPKNVNMALLNYPVLMAADILIYKASAVPVGIDQEPHLEIAREIARKMNEIYATDFPQPRRFETAAPYVPSLLGEGKMSKSVEGSYINLTDDLATIKKRLAAVPTDSGRGRISEIINHISYISDTGGESHGVSALMEFVELFQGREQRLQYQKQYQSTGLQYNKLKLQLAEAIFKQLEPIQNRRQEFESEPAKVEKILRDGAVRARQIAGGVVNEVKRKMGLG